MCAVREPEQHEPTQGTIKKLADGDEREKAGQIGAKMTGNAISRLTNRQLGKLANL